MDDLLEFNRRNWEDRASVHPTTAYYDVPGFLDGESTLRSIERDELDDVGEGTTLCHLMCHIGLDTLSWARKGADVVGIDFSPTALAAARDIASEAGLTDHASFVEADTTDPDSVRAAIDDVRPGADEGRCDGEGFDVVVASYGVLVWLPTMTGLADVAAELLAPGGTFCLVDGHPLSHTIDDTGEFAYDYFRKEPYQIDQEGTYADREADIQHTTTFQWAHTLGDVVSAVAAAGLRVESLREFPYTHFEKFDGMVETGGWWRPQDEPELPLMFSLRATKK